MANTAGQRHALANSYRRANAAGQWHALICCHGRHRGPAAPDRTMPPKWTARPVCSPRRGGLRRGGAGRRGPAGQPRPTQGSPADRRAGLWWRGRNSKPLADSVPLTPGISHNSNFIGACYWPTVSANTGCDLELCRGSDHSDTHCALTSGRDGSGAGGREPDGPPAPRPAHGRTPPGPNGAGSPALPKPLCGRHPPEGTVQAAPSPDIN